jgi:hypothetical protein
MFTLSIRTDNAAFEPERGSEVARILRHLADRLEGCGHYPNTGRVKDGNGNTVGEFTLTEEA